MTTKASQITSLTVVYSTVYSDTGQRKHQSSGSLAFVWGIHRDRWIPRTNGQLRGKCFHLITSSCCKEHQRVHCKHYPLSEEIKYIIKNTITYYYWYNIVQFNNTAHENSHASQTNHSYMFSILRIFKGKYCKFLINRGCVMGNPKFVSFPGRHFWKWPHGCHVSPNYHC